MKIKLVDGTTIERGFNEDGLMGYRCDSVELRFEDARDLLELYERDPIKFRHYLRQFWGRFKVPVV